MPHFFSQIQSMYESPRQNWFSIFRPYYLLLKLFKRRKCASVIQPNSFKWTIHIYCWWCWGVYANSFSLCSGRVCPFSPLTTRRRRQLNVVVWSLLKELAEVSFLTKTSALSLPKFKRMLPVLPYWVLIFMLSAALIASKLLNFYILKQTCIILNLAQISSVLTEGGFTQWCLLWLTTIYMLALWDS